MAKMHYGSVYKTEFDGVLFEDRKQCDAYDTNAACSIILEAASGGLDAFKEAITCSDYMSPIWKAIDWLSENSHSVISGSSAEPMPAEPEEKE